MPVNIISRAHVLKKEMGGSKTSASLYSSLELLSNIPFVYLIFLFQKKKKKSADENFYVYET